MIFLDTPWSIHWNSKEWKPHAKCNFSIRTILSNIYLALITGLKNWKVSPKSLCTGIYTANETEIGYDSETGVLLVFMHKLKHVAKTECYC